MRAAMYPIQVPSWFTDDEAVLVASARVMMRNWSGLRKLEHFTEANGDDGQPGSENLQLAYAHVLGAFRSGGASYREALDRLLKVQLFGTFNYFGSLEGEERSKSGWELKLGRSLFDPSGASDLVRDAAFLLHANHAVFADNGDLDLGMVMAEFMDEYFRQAFSASMDSR